MTAYLLITFCLNGWRFKSIHHPRKEIIVHVFDSATFATSFLLLAGIFSPPVLTALGSTKPFLLIAALAGLLYSIGIWFPRNGKD